MTSGDIYLIEIPSSGGHEQQGARPAIIVQTNENMDKIPTILVIPFTTQMKASTFPFTFAVKPDTENNLASTSVALVFQIRAIDKKRLKSKIGSLTAKDLRIIKKIISSLIGLTLHKQSQ